MPNGGRLWSWDWSMAGAPHDTTQAIAKSFAQFRCKMSEVERRPVAMFHRVYISRCAPVRPSIESCIHCRLDSEQNEFQSTAGLHAGHGIRLHHRGGGQAVPEPAG